MNTLHKLIFTSALIATPSFSVTAFAQTTMSNLELRTTAIPTVQSIPTINNADLSRGLATSEQEVDTKPYAIKPIKLSNRLDSGIFVDCQQDECVQSFREVTSNLDEDEIEKRFLDNVRFNNVEFQRANLEAYAEISKKAMKIAEEHIISGQKSTHLDVVIYLEEQAFDFRQLRNLRKAEERSAFDAIILQRKEQLSKSQSTAEEMVERLGGKPISRQFLSNTLIASLPAASLEKLLSLLTTNKFRNKHVHS